MDRRTPGGNEQDGQWWAPGGDALERGADRAIGAASAGWWARADDNQKLAVWAAVAAVTIGPLGLGVAGLLKVLYGGPSVPGSEQLQAVFYLLVITAPIAIGVGIIVFLAGKVATPGLVLLAGGASYLAGAGVASATMTKLGDFYCYAGFKDGAVVYETGCRAYDQAGFIAATGGPPGSPGEAAEVMGWAFVFVSESRGAIMAVAGVVAAAAVAYLLRRESE